MPSRAQAKAPPDLKFLDCEGGKANTSPPHIEHIRAAVVNPQFNSDRPISGLPRTGVS